MARRSLYVAIAASAFAVGGHVAQGATASAAMAHLDGSIVVRETGVSTIHLGRRTTRASWGVVLANTSRTHDALAVTVAVKLVAPNGTAVPGQGRVVRQRLPLIPAGKTFYLGGETTLLGDGRVRGVRAEVTAVGSTPSKRYVLPPMSDVYLDTSTGQMAGTVRNPYSMAISSYDLTADIVFFDRRGRVIGGGGPGEIGNLESDLEPGSGAPVSFFVPDGLALSRIASARVTLSPG